jgi:hypothetical protein
MTTEHVLSNDDFQDAIRKFIKLHELGGPKGFGKRFGIAIGTIEHWLYKGIVSPTCRARRIASLPEVFDSSENVTETTSSGGSTFVARLKMELVQERVLTLSLHLTWFLFTATEAERDQLREILGDKWSYFIELTRAMTSETAFRMAREEGRLLDGNIDN